MKFICAFALIIISISYSYSKECPNKLSIKLLNNSQFQNSESELTKYFPVKRPKAIVLVSHGLNLKPSKMNEIVEVLNNAQMSVLRMSLSGHRGDFLEMKSIDFTSWSNQSFLHHCLANKIALKQKVPLYRVTYSLSSLISIASNIEYNQFDVKKQIMLAPAITPRWYTHIFNALLFLDDETEIPSQNLENYRARASTSLAAYRAMKEARNIIDNFPFNPISNVLDIATIIYVDPEDELVSVESLTDEIKQRNLQGWNVLNFQAPSNFEVNYHHLIIDSKQLDQYRWSKLVKSLTNLPTEKFGLKEN